MITREQLPEGNIRLTFSLPTGEPSGDVSVVGSFNDWCPGRHLLLGEQDGPRTVSVLVEPGTYHFRYLGTGGVWFDDEDADAVGEHGGVLHCHRTDAPVGDGETLDASRIEEELDAVLEEAESLTDSAEGKASAKTTEKGRRPRAAAR